MNEIGAFSILAVTVSLSLTRPKIGPIRLHHSYAAMIGAFLSLISGIVPLGLAFHALKVLFYPVITIVSLMIITLVAEQAGLFAVMATRIARMANGDARKLFKYLFFCGATTGALFTNDAAVLIFTPLVFNLVEEVKDPSWTHFNKVPFYFAVLYVANLVGAFVISNPINIIVSSLFGIDFLEYAKWMIIPALVSVTTSYFGLKAYFKNDIPATFVQIPEDTQDPKNYFFMGMCAFALLLTLVGFFGSGVIGVPTWIVALTSAVMLLILHGVIKRSNSFEIVRHVGWDVIVFVIGIFIIAYGMRNAGLTDRIGHLLDNIPSSHLLKLTSVTGFTAAFFSSLMNNHPTANIMAMVIDDMKAPRSLTRMLVFSALIGGDLGPKMLPIGSLAALLWFRILRNKGVHITYSLYIKIGVPITLTAILLSILTLNAEFYIQHWLTGR
jgi:arsenical pump membrane protein